MPVQPVCLIVVTMVTPAPTINDPDIRSNNRTIKILRKKKIYINKGIYEKKLNFFYRSYIKSKKSFLPFVTCKLAVSKDFFTVDKKNKWITNKFSRARVHLMRSNHDCVMTSSKTVISDNSPSRLELRIPTKSRVRSKRH